MTREYPPEVERWRELVEAMFPAEEVGKALWVIQHESAGRPDALGDYDPSRNVYAAIGLFQIQSRVNFSNRPTSEWLMEPMNNIAYARLMVGREGWAPWGEDNTHNGQPFGALGRHPYPGDEDMELVFTRMPAEGPITGNFGDWYTGGGVPYQHRGVDIGCPSGTRVYAPAKGITVVPVNDGSFGVAVCIEHSGTKWFSLYAHLNEAFVLPGEFVEEGQLLGYSGNTGMSTGPHLHWQVCRSASFPRDITQSADPLSFLREPTEEDEMTPEQLARMERLERLMGGNGIRPEGMPDAIITGEAALAEMDRRGLSMHLGFDLLAERVGKLEAKS